MRVRGKFAGAALLLVSFAAGCTPYIPVKDDFGTSALAPAGNTPPEFAEFNAYDPRVNPLLAAQYCATPYQPLEGKTLDSSTGYIVQQRGRCESHVPLWGP